MSEGSKAEFPEYVLLVDDDQAVLDSVKGFLEEAGYKVRAVADVSSAMALIKDGETKFFLVISDVYMADKDGIQFLEETRASFPHLPFILITGLPSNDITSKALRGKADDIQEKPVDSRRLLSSVEHIFEERYKAIREEEEHQEMLMNTFLEEMASLCDGMTNMIIALETSPDDQDLVNNLYRRVHTIKGGAGSINSGASLQVFLHCFENVLTAIKNKKIQPSLEVVTTMIAASEKLELFLGWFSEPNTKSEPDTASITAALRQHLENRPQQSTHEAAADVPPPDPQPAKADANPGADQEDGIMVSNYRLDRFMELAGDLVAFKNNFQENLLHTGETAATSRTMLEDMNRGLSKISDQIQTMIMEIRKVPLANIYARFPRVVRQVAVQNKKSIKLITEGAELEVDKTIARTLSGFLIHIIRNSCDHGIEDPVTRKSKSKPAQGVIRIIAKEADDNIIVIVEDDGNGLSREKIASKALNMDLITEDEYNHWSNEQIFELIFHPGLSTAKSVTDISGRGVGMDVVKNAIVSINGDFRVESEPGQFTRFTFTIPIPKTVIIEQSVIAKTQGVLMAIPLGCIAKISSIDLNQVNLVESGWYYQFSGKSIPLATYQWFSGQRRGPEELEPKADGLVIVIAHKGREIGLVIERVFEQIEAVIRPFDPVVNNVRGFKGTSELSNNELAYVLSPEEMVEMALSREAG